MQAKTKKLLEEAKTYCEANYKSTAFTIQYMQDYANVDCECVVKFLIKNRRVENESTNASK